MSNRKGKILLVDDEEDILEFLTYNLLKEGFEIHATSNPMEALVIGEKIKPNLILLDIMMPEMDGIELCKKLRESPQFNNSLIAILTARSEDYSQIAGFQSGADDYIVKPIKPRVLISRINALLRRAPAARFTQEISLGDITINSEQHLLKKNDQTMLLPKKEFELLALLMSKSEKVFTRGEILKTVWGDSIIVDTRTINVHIRKLREKLGEEYIKTIIGVGYKFEYNKNKIPVA